MDSTQPNPVPRAESSSAEATCTVSVIIKALNEERHIQLAVQSALNGISHVGGEVILADSLSNDRTIALAIAHPIRVVQLTDPLERSCGIGPQLGYQHSCGEFIYIMDGDMQLVDGFLEAGIAILRARPDLAGVGGRLIELNTESLEYVQRESRIAKFKDPVIVDRLDGGGLYRRSAIETVGYLSDRNLHSYEEYDLGTRLRAAGWKLLRVPQSAVSHFGHDQPPYELLRRRFRSRYIFGMGELIRGAIGQPRFFNLVFGLAELRLYLLVVLWWGFLASLFFWPVSLFWKLAIAIAAMVFPFVSMAWRKRSWAQARYSVTSWSCNAAGLLLGLLGTPRSPREPISTRILREPSSRVAPTSSVPTAPLRAGTVLSSQRCES
jgi:glycosyltransferase involved in cell wall biosynthesis